MFKKNIKISKFIYNFLIYILKFKIKNPYLKNIIITKIYINKKFSNINIYFIDFLKEYSLNIKKEIFILIKLLNNIKNYINYKIKNKINNFKKINLNFIYDKSSLKFEKKISLLEINKNYEKK
ncbi:putative ribosome-binding factor A [Candidatus Zinderia insecticola CARI]|uniref:Putative ribosome-binding factor A n=1 Tax=Zinderia insecticola (strain CARI) TaxID=871271 RepID=E4PYU6_ZINIC|nr:putative ribosome-binding factor A [Candidatus Zinderia insecticola CARI]